MENLVDDNKVEEVTPEPTPTPEPEPTPDPVPTPEPTADPVMVPSKGGGAKKDNTLINLLIICIAMVILFYILNAYFQAKQKAE